MKPYFQTKAAELAFISIVLLAFVAFYIETDIYTPSFPAMVSYFGTTEESIQLLISMNFLGLCVSSLFFGPASDAYGRKAILCTGLFIFMVGSVGCAVTESFDWMVGYRLLQGLGCGAIVSAGLAMFFDVFDPEKSAQLVSVCNGTLGGLMALAPIVGNIISLQLGWRANFYLIASLATLSFFSFAFLVKETLPVAKRTPLKLGNVLRNYGSLLVNFPFMAYNIMWCLMFSVVLVFIANLSLIYVDYLQVSTQVFGFYQAGIMGAFFVGSMSGAYCIKKWGMLATKMAGNVIFLTGVFGLALLSLMANESPVLLIIAMSLTSLGCALAVTIYFTVSMGFIGDHLKGSAMSLTQSMRLLMSSGLIWIAAYHFDGSTKPMSLISVLCTAVCILLYVMMHQRKTQLAEQKTAQ